VGLNVLWYEEGSPYKAFLLSSSSDKSLSVMLIFVNISHLAKEKNKFKLLSFLL